MGAESLFRCLNDNGYNKNPMGAVVGEFCSGSLQLAFYDMIGLKIEALFKIPVDEA